MEEYKQWLEQQIERCLKDKDLQREHWAFCKAYEKFTALHQQPVSGELNCEHNWLVEYYDHFGFPASMFCDKCNTREAI